MDQETPLKKEISKLPEKEAAWLRRFFLARGFVEPQLKEAQRITEFFLSRSLNQTASAGDFSTLLNQAMINTIATYKGNFENLYAYLSAYKNFDINRLNINRDDFEDIFQKSMAGLAVKYSQDSRHSDVGPIKYIRAYFRTIIAREFKRYVENKDEHFISLEDTLVVPSRSDDLTGIATMDFLQSQLSESDLRILLMHYTEGYEYSEIAEALHLTETATRKRASRVIAKLREALKKSYD